MHGKKWIWSREKTLFILSVLEGSWRVRVTPPVVSVWKVSPIGVFEHLNASGWSCLVEAGGGGATLEKEGQ